MLINFTRKQNILKNEINSVTTTPNSQNTHTNLFQTILGVGKIQAVPLYHERQPTSLSISHAPISVTLISFKDKRGERPQQVSWLAFGFNAAA